MTSSLPRLGAILMISLLVAVPVALAEEITRDEYVARVEPICKANTEANSRILKGVKEQVKKDELLPAGSRFIRAASALGKAVKQIAAVPQPAEDTTKLTKWIGYLKREEKYLREIGQALKANDKKDKFRAQKLAVELNKNNNKANNTVISFPFHECRIDSSRFL
ncbi:MAG: hypothetical protein WBM00_00585 [Solirubrobacterales bacterium]